MMHDEGKWFDGVWFAEHEAAVFNTVGRMLDSGPVNLLLTGPSGEGKTDRPRAWAKANHMAFAENNVALTRDTEEVFGWREASNGDTVFHLNPMAEALRKGNAVILLDELNRAEPWILNSLLPLLDFRRQVNVRGNTIVVGPRVLFVATANVGYEFTGTWEPDAALMNRIDVHLHVEPPPPEITARIVARRTGLDESTATAIANTLALLRDEAQDGDGAGRLSTRTAIRLGNLVAAGMPLRNAFEVAIVTGCTPESAKALTDVLNHELGPVGGWNWWRER